jgi:hypothetical protein
MLGRRVMSKNHNFMCILTHTTEKKGENQKTGQNNIYFSGFMKGRSICENPYLNPTQE